MKTNISDEEFEKLKAAIKSKWKELEALQKEYQKLTGKRHEWFK